MAVQNFASIAEQVAASSGLEGRWVGDDFVTFVDHGVRLVLTCLDERSFSYLFFRLGDLDYTSGVRTYTAAKPAEFAKMLHRS